MIYYEIVLCDIVLKTEADKSSGGSSQPPTQEALESEIKPATSANDHDLKTIYDDYHETQDGLVLDPPRLSKSAHDSKFKKLRHSSIGPQLEVPKLSEFHELLTDPSREVPGPWAEQSRAPKFCKKFVKRL